MRKYFCGIFLIAMCVLSMSITIGYAQDEANQLILRNGEYDTVKIDNKNFTGTVFLQNLVSPQMQSNTYGAMVTFEPGARTNWHIHPARQVLIVTDGIGYTQQWGKDIQILKPGDIVFCPPNVKHWHGASKNSFMTHLAISEKTDKDVIWLEAVNNEVYFD